ncbi:hypothetical protein NQZ68_038496 [Dissostichus eleginoides]|nr:hypothetical protein NQZ68_038496 [Dissostichus eleginoides]
MLDKKGQNHIAYLRLVFGQALRQPNSDSTHTVVKHTRYVVPLLTQTGQGIPEGLELPAWTGVRVTLPPD